MFCKNIFAVCAFHNIMQYYIFFTALYRFGLGVDPPHFFYTLPNEGKSAKKKIRKSLNFPSCIISGCPNARWWLPLIMD